MRPKMRPVCGRACLRLDGEPTCEQCGALRGDKVNEGGRQTGLVIPRQGRPMTSRISGPRPFLRPPLTSKTSKPELGADPMAEIKAALTLRHVTVDQLCDELSTLRYRGFGDAIVEFETAGHLVLTVSAAKSIGVIPPSKATVTASKGAK